MSRVIVDVAWPWLTDEYETCPFIDEKWIPVNNLAVLLGIDKKDAKKLWKDHTVRQVEGGGTNRNFINIDDLPYLLHKQGWDEEKIDKGLKCFETPAPPPMRKRSVERSIGEQESDPYLAKGPSKRREGAAEIPSWAVAFMDECRKTVGNQAMEQFIATPEYATRCKEAIAEKMEELDKELRKQLTPIVKDELREEFRLEAKREFEQQQKAASMLRFKLPVNPVLNDNLLTFAFSTRNGTVE